MGKNSQRTIKKGVSDEARHDVLVVDWFGGESNASLS